MGNGLNINVMYIYSYLIYEITIYILKYTLNYVFILYSISAKI